MELGDGFAFVFGVESTGAGGEPGLRYWIFSSIIATCKCLVAFFELKTGRFEPEHMGKLAFYLEALDRDRKRPHEKNPSIGVLLCRTKDDEVAEYAMNRHLFCRRRFVSAVWMTQMDSKVVITTKTS